LGPTISGEIGDGYGMLWMVDYWNYWVKHIRIEMVSHPDACSIADRQP
jgi:hypothetical protein